MKTVFGLLLSSLLLISFTSCEEKQPGNRSCQTITLGEPFEARIGETWCRPADNWEITFEKTVEDSRCNVPGIECIWAGRYVLAAHIHNGEITRDTFFAVHDWRDTIYSGSYEVILQRVLPATRPEPGPIAEEAYSFEMLVRNQ